MPLPFLLLPREGSQVAGPSCPWLYPTVQSSAWLGDPLTPPAPREVRLSELHAGCAEPGAPGRDAAPWDRLGWRSGELQDRDAGFWPLAPNWATAAPPRHCWCLRLATLSAAAQRALRRHWYQDTRIIPIPEPVAAGAPAGRAEPDPWAGGKGRALPADTKRPGESCRPGDRSPARGWCSSGTAAPAPSALSLAQGLPSGAQPRDSGTAGLQCCGGQLGQGRR